MIPSSISLEQTGKFSNLFLDYIEGNPSLSPFYNFRPTVDSFEKQIKLKQSLKPGGNFIIATFELEGPEKCSGLPVVRYDHKTLEKLFSENFKLISSKKESHLTPFDTRQEFIYCHFQKTHA